MTVSRMRDKYRHHITYAKDIPLAEELSDDEYEEYISLLIFIGDDGRLWTKHGHKRVYYDRLNKYYDLKKRKWVNK